MSNTFEVGSIVRVRLGENGRPPTGEVVKVYANGDLRVRITTGRHADEMHRLNAESLVAL